MVLTALMRTRRLKPGGGWRSEASPVRFRLVRFDVGHPEPIVHCTNHRSLDIGRSRRGVLAHLRQFRQELPGADTHFLGHVPDSLTMTRRTLELDKTHYRSPVSCLPAGIRWLASDGGAGGKGLEQSDMHEPFSPLSEPIRRHPGCSYTVAHLPQQDSGPGQPPQAVARGLVLLHHGTPRN